MSLPDLPRCEIHKRARAMSGRALAARELVARARAGQPVSAEEVDRVAQDLEEAVELLRQAL